MAFDKLGEAFVEIYLKDEKFQRKLLGVGGKFTSAMGGITQAAGKASVAGIGVLTASLKGTEKQVNSLSGASVRLTNAFSGSTAKIATSFGGSASKIVTASGRATSAGVGVLTAGLKGTEHQITAVSRASSKMIGTLGQVGSKITQSSGRAANAGIGVLTAGLKGTERQVNAVSSASAKMIGTLGNAASRIGNSLGKSAASKIDLSVKTAAFKQKLDHASKLHRSTLSNMQQRSQMRISLADQEYRAKLRRLAKDTKSTTGTMREAFAGVLAGIGISRMIGSAQRGFTSLISTGFAFNSQLEQMRTSFTQMIGDAGRADKVLGDIRKFSEDTPFQIGDLTSAAVALMSTRKIAEDQLLPTLQKLGDAAAGSAEGFSAMPRITRAITQMLSKGKLQAEEMMQLAEAGIPAWDALAQATGKSAGELQKMGQEGKLGADMVLKLIDGLGARFEGLAAKQAKTFSGLWSTFSDKARSAIGQVTKPLFDLSTITLDNLVKFADSDAMKSFVKFAVDGMSKVSAAIKAAFESPLAMAVAKFAVLAGAATVATAAVAGVVSAAVSFSGILAPLAAITAVVTAISAGVTAMAASFRSALQSERGQAILANLVRIKDLAIEVGMNLRDAIGSGIDFIASKFDSLFGGNAAGKMGAFWESATSKMVGFMDMVSLLTTNFGRTWEIVKAGAALAVSDMWDRFKYLLNDQIPFAIAGMVEGMMAGGKVIVDGWWELFVGVVASIDQLFAGMISAQKRRIEGIIKASKAIAFGNLGDAAEALVFGEFEAAKIQYDSAVKAGKAFRDNAGDVVADAAKKFSEAFSKTQAAMPEFQRSDRGNAINEYLGSLVDSVAAERENVRAQRAATDALAAAIAANEKLATASQMAAAAAEKKAAADAAAAASKGPQLTETESQFAADLNERFKDPVDRFKEAAKKINELFGKGGINEDVRKRAIQDEMDKAAKDGEKNKKSAAFTTPAAIANKLQEAITGGNVEEKQLAALKDIAAAVARQVKLAEAKEKLGELGGKAMGAADAIKRGDFAGAWDIISGKTEEQKKARENLDAANAAVAAAAAEAAAANATVREKFAAASAAVDRARSAAGDISGSETPGSFSDIGAGFVDAVASSAAGGISGQATAVEDVRNRLPGLGMGGTPTLGPPRVSREVKERSDAESKSEKATAKNTKAIADAMNSFGRMASGFVNFAGGS